MTLSYRCLATLIVVAAVCCLATVAKAKPPCPAQAPCQCTDLRIKCVQQLSGSSSSQHLNYLTAVPYFAPSNSETRWSYSFHELRIRGQAMTSLSLRYDFGVLNVRRVEASSSLVRRLQPGAFRGLLGVESLNLSHNLLSSLGPEDLQDLPSLRELVLHNNLIATVAPGSFVHSAFISKLYLSHNLLAEIPSDIRQLTGLTHLYLQFNNISVVRNNAFYGLSRLIILDLGALRTGLVIQRRAFCGLAPPSAQDGSGLVALYLRHNILQSLDLCAIGQARRLRGLNLTGAIFPCSCQALSLPDHSRGDWTRRYGFAPRYVTYEQSVLLGCAVRSPPLLECPLDAELCRDACRHQPDEEAADRSQMSIGFDAAMQHPGYRLTLRRGQGASSGSGSGSNEANGGSNSSHACHRCWWLLFSKLLLFPLLPLLCRSLLLHV